MICDLNGQGDNLSWILDQPLFDPDWLDLKTRPVAQI